MDFAYDVFLSHNSKDRDAVEYLACRLEDEAGLKVFLDKWNLVPGDPWQEDLEQALAASRTVAVFLGPAGIGGWHNEELREALDQRVSDPARRVIPVLLPGTTLPAENAIPAFLARLTWVDFRAGLEDEGAFRRLAAGIRGEPPGRGDGPLEKPISPPATAPEDAPAGPGSGPVFHGNFQGTYVARDQTVIRHLEDRSVHINAPVTGSAIITGRNNMVHIGGEASLGDFRELLEQMSQRVGQAGLAPAEAAEALADIERVQAEAAKPAPNRGILLKHLGGLVEFLANTATVTTAAPQLAEMGRQALEWARALF